MQSGHSGIIELEADYKMIDVAGMLILFGLVCSNPPLLPLGDVNLFPRFRGRVINQVSWGGGGVTYSHAIWQVCDEGLRGATHFYLTQLPGKADNPMVMNKLCNPMVMNKLCSSVLLWQVLKFKERDRERERECF